MSKRKILIVTGTRAEYGLMHWLMRDIADDPDLELYIVATCMHLSREFGLTYQLIEQDGFTINDKVEMLLSSDTTVGVAKSTGLATISFADSFARLKPDIIVVLGDRFEILAAAQAAMILHIPVAHIHGGEVTEGAIDESIRHAVTKLAHLHFPVTETYRRRVIQLGESPERVYNFGAPGLDHIQRTCLLNRNELAKQLDFEFGALNFVITYHPVTIRRSGSHEGLYTLLAALDHFPQAHILFTKSNADEGGRLIGEILDDYVERRKGYTKVYPALGLLRYLSMAKEADAVIGNSSSGLIEVPYVKTPTVNIGERERGRLQASSIINCEENSQAISDAITRALSAEFQQTMVHVTSPYGQGDASKKIKEVLKAVDLEPLLMKRFYDLPNDCIGDKQTKEAIVQ